MSKQYRIRWQETDKQDIAKAVKNFNAKIDRIAKKHPELKSALPEKITVGGMVNLIGTRQDLKRELNALKRFTDRKNVIGYDKEGNLVGITTISDNKYNTKITDWQNKEINRRLPTINKRREERLNRLKERDVKSRGKEQGYKKGHLGFGRAELLELSPMEGLTPGMSAPSLKMKYRAILLESQKTYFTDKDYRTKENYIKGLHDNFSSKDVKEIAKRIKEMPIDEFLEIFHTDNEAKFEGLYAPNEREYKKYLNSLKAVWLPKR